MDKPPFNQKKYQDNRDHKEGSNFRYNKNPNDRFQNREGGNDRFQNREGNSGFQNREGGNDRYQNREGGGYQNREGNSGDRFQNREGNSGDRFQNRNAPNRFPPREGGSGDRFQNRDNRSNFQPRTGPNNRDFRGNQDNRGGTGRPDNFRPNSGGKFAPKSGPPNNRFAPRGKFQPGPKTAKTWNPEDNIKIVSDKQVTDGKHKGKYLENTVSVKAQITSRRIREAMFKILSRKIRAGRFLDLCAGSGTMGIEAISRGAIISTFVERSAKMCSFIKKNLKSLEINEGHGTVVEMEVMPFLKQMKERRRFWDVVYLDAPLDSSYDEIFSYLNRGAAVAPGGVLVIEHPSEVFLPEASGVLRRWRVVLQGERAISFFERK